MPLDEPLWAATTYRCYGCVDIEQMRDSIPDKEKGVYVVLVHPDMIDEDDYEEG